MATTEQYYDGGQASYTFSIEKIKDQDIKVAVDGTDLDYTATNPPAQTTEYTVNGSNVIFKQASVSGSAIDGVRVYRETALENADSATFVAGSSIRAADLNANHKLVRFSAQEKNQKIVTDDIRDSQITSAKIVDGTIVNADLNASAAIAGTKVTPSFGSQNVSTTGTAATGALTVTGNIAVSGTVDNRDVAADGTKLDTIETNSKDDQTAAEIKTLLQSDKITDSEIATGTLDNRYYTETELDGGQLDNRYYTETELNAGQLDNRYYTETELDAGQLDNRYFTETELTNGSLDGRYFTETELTNGALDGRYFTETESDARYFNISSGDTIKDGEAFPDNDTTIATTAAINDRIIDLVDDVGGFVPIANETSFPTSNPDVNNGTGTIVSVSAASTNLTPSGTTVTISNGAGTGNTVTITGVSSTIPSGFGFLVETTGTLHTYTFHRLSPKATEVTTVAGKATEIGLLGTTAVVEDLSILGTADVVADLAILGTTDVVADLNTLGTADVVADLNTLGTADVVNDMNVLGTSANVTAMSNCSDSIASINNASSNLNSINNYGDQYQVSANNPSTDGGGNALAAGDLYFNTSANELKVYNGSSWQAGVTSTGNYALTTGNTFTGDNRYNDGVKALFGTGSDLEIFHNGSQSVIKDNGTGQLLISGENTVAITNAAATENYARFIKDGAAELYYDNSKKFETTSAGATLTGDLTVTGTFPKILLTDADHNPDYSIINANGEFKIFSETDSVSRIKVKPDGTVEVINDLQIPNDTGKIQLGASQDLEIFHDGSHSRIKDVGTGNLFISGTNTQLINAAGSETIAKFTENGPVQLYYDNSLKFETTSYGGIFGNETSSSVAIPVRLSLGGTYHNQGGGDPKLSVWTNGTEHMGFGVSGNQLDVILTQNDYDFVVYSGSTERLRVHGDGAGVDIPDNAALRFGNSQDFKLYHDGSNSRLENNTGAFIVKNTAQDGDVQIQGNDGGSNINLLLFDTSEAGNAEFSGDIKLTDGKKVKLGASDDLTLSHKFINNSFNGVINNATNTLFIESDNITIRDKSGEGAETLSSFVKNGAASLYYDNSKKFETTSNGTQATGNLRVDGNLDLYDDKRLRCGDSAELQIYYDGNSFIRDMGGGNLFLDTNGTKIQLAADGTSSKTMANFIKEGAVELYHNGTKKFETDSGGVTLFDDLFVLDNNIIYCGDGLDLLLMSDGSTSFIRADDLRIRSKDNLEDHINCFKNYGTSIYYDNGKKFETLSTGAIAYNSLYIENTNTKLEQANSSGTLKISTQYGYISVGPQNSSYAHIQTDRPEFYFNTHIKMDGSIIPYGTSGSYSLGSSSARWANIYSMDLHLSNEGSSNDMDGTWGDWTIQEGISDLFLKNNRSGKKYKFNLTEVA